MPRRPRLPLSHSAGLGVAKLGEPSRSRTFSARACACFIVGAYPKGCLCGVPKSMWYGCVCVCVRARARAGGPACVSVRREVAVALTRTRGRARIGKVRVRAQGCQRTRVIPRGSSSGGKRGLEDRGTSLPVRARLVLFAPLLRGGG